MMCSDENSLKKEKTIYIQDWLICSDRVFQTLLVGGGWRRKTPAHLQKNSRHETTTNGKPGSAAQKI